MKKKRYIALTLILSLLCIDKTYAACTKELKDEFLELKSQYKITNTFVSESKTYTVRIERANTDKFVYTTAITAQYNCKKISDTVTECYGLEPGKSFYAYILGNTSDCNIRFREEEIKLAKYNQFYGDPLCEGIEEFVLCQEIYDREIDRESFEYRVNAYKKSKQEKLDEEAKQQEEENKVSNKIISYLKENTIQVIIVAIFIILVTISSIIGYKSIKKSRRLE